MPAHDIKVGGGGGGRQNALLVKLIKLTYSDEVDKKVPDSLRIPTKNVVNGVIIHPASNCSGRFER